MNIRYALLFAIALSCSPILAQQIVDINYTYEGVHRVGLSQLGAGLYFADFEDDRGTPKTRIITESTLGNPSASTGYQAELPLAEIVRDAILQGFSYNDLSQTNPDGFTFEGNLLSSDAKLVELNGVPSMQIVFRTVVQLQQDGRVVR